MSSFDMPPQTTLGPIALRTANLSLAVKFYTDVIGLQLVARDPDRALMGGREGVPLVVLVEEADAMPKPAHTSGLYHFAILLPTRFELARVLRHLTEFGYPLQGASDHLVSEALYLADPDGNGIEICADRPRETWQWRDGQIQMATVPLNVEDLLHELARDVGPWMGLPAGARIGHVHLHVGDLELAEQFYHQILGFGVVARYGLSASFMSAGGYHHHIGMNTWIGAGAPPPPPNAVGLVQFTICLPDKKSLLAMLEHLRSSDIPFVEDEASIVLHDPSDNQIVVTVGPLAKPAAPVQRAIAY